jgi:capsular polysaccharide biosynthesis protein
MELQNAQDTELEIDLLELFRVLLSKIWIIVLSGITLGLVVIAATILFVTPQYESTTKMYVLNKQDSSTLTSSDLQSSLSLTKEYAVLIKSRTVTESVITQLNLDMTSKELLSKISVSSETDTRVLTITVTDEDPYEACQIANAVRDVAANHIKNVMDIDAVNVVETANIPQEKSSPSLAKNGILGGALGLFLAIAIVLIVYLSNDTVKTQEDVEKYLGLSVLGTIPLMDMANTSGKSKKQKNKRRRRS